MPLPSARTRELSPTTGRPCVIAVGVNHGDAFLGAHGDYRFLVDGGDRTDNAARILAAAGALDRHDTLGSDTAGDDALILGTSARTRAPAIGAPTIVPPVIFATASDRDRIFLASAGGEPEPEPEPAVRFDVVICTHADRDHANGVLGLLSSCQQRRAAVQELWLPAEWATVAARHGDLGSGELARRVYEELNADDTRFAMSGRAAFTAGESTAGDHDEAEGFLAEASPLALYASQAATLRGLFGTAPGAALTTVYLAALSRIDLITKIVAAGRAVVRDIIWWQYDRQLTAGQQSSSTLRGPFRALNCYQTTTPPPVTAAINAMTSRTNERSLVFGWLPQDAPPALFTADSPLNFPLAAATADGMLATAAHHGSPTNAATFSLITRLVSNPDRVLWLRGSYKRIGKANYPSSEFLRQRHRACVEAPCKQASRDVTARCGRSGWELEDPASQCPRATICRGLRCTADAIALSTRFNGIL
jgi:hypothetical protein